MADAAEKQLGLIWWQNFGNFVQGGLLLVTIFFSGWAAIAASRSFKTAEETLSLAKATERGFAYPEIVANNVWRLLEDLKLDQRQPSAGSDPRFGFVIDNPGKTQVVIHKLRGRLLFQLDPPTDFPPEGSSLDPPFSPHMIGPTSKSTKYRPIAGRNFSKDDIDPLQKGEWKMWLIGDITHEDVFRGPDTERFCYVYDVDTNNLVRDGPYNDNPQVPDPVRRWPGVWARIATGARKRFGLVAKTPPAP